MSILSPQPPKVKEKGLTMREGGQNKCVRTMMEKRKMGYELDPTDPRDMYTGWQTAESPMEKDWYADRIKERFGVDPKKFGEILKEVK